MKIYFECMSLVSLWIDNLPVTSMDFYSFFPTFIPEWVISGFVSELQLVDNVCRLWVKTKLPVSCCLNRRAVYDISYIMIKRISIGVQKAAEVGVVVTQTVKIKIKIVTAWELYTFYLIGGGFHLVFDWYLNPKFWNSHRLLSSS